jgi:LPPG:FO 2-phospho-L-lactate transferase
VTGLSYRGAETAGLNREIVTMRRNDAPSAVVICPSNPYLSIEPILAVPGMRQWLGGLNVPIIAVSPIVGGTAIKGPAAKIMNELGVAVSAATVAERYRGLIHGIVIDHVDEPLCAGIEATGIAVKVTQTVMRSAADRGSLARDCLSFADALKSRDR